VEDGGKGLDPSVFEGAFAIEDDSEDPSRAGTPAPAEKKAEKISENGTNEETTGDGEAAVIEKVDSVSKPPTVAELPPDVRTKLRKLEKLEARYQGMLECTCPNLAKAYTPSRTSLLIPHRSRSCRINRAFRKDFEREYPLIDYQ
jgi:hypothetical protein